MNVENLKRWHWAIVGLLIGLLVGWCVKSMNDVGGISDAGTIGVREFERELTQTNRGYPVLKTIVVHRAAGHELVTMRRLEVDPAERYPQNPRHYRYVLKRLDARTPYVPADASQTVEVRIDPAAELMSARGGRQFWTLGINGERVFDWSARLKLSGWTSDPNHWSDPGGGATVEVEVRPAAYELSVVLDASQKDLDLSQSLRTTVNDHPLPPLTRVTGAALPTWRCVIPKSSVAPGRWQSFKFARNAVPAKIREIRLEDPGFTVIEYLAAMRRQHPQLSFSTAWWERPIVLYIMCAAAGVIIVGGIWPTLLNLLVGAGFGRKLPEQEAYDLSRFKGEPEPQVVKSEATAEPLDVDQLSALEEELRRSLAEQAAQSDRPASEPVPQLSGDASPAPVPEAQDEQKDYRGEYYPVARKHSEDHPAH